MKNKKEIILLLCILLGMSYGDNIFSCEKSCPTIHFLRIAKSFSIQQESGNKTVLYLETTKGDTYDITRKSAENLINYSFTQLPACILYRVKDVDDYGECKSMRGLFFTPEALNTLRTIPLEKINDEVNQEKSMLGYIGEFTYQTILSKIDPGCITPTDYKEITKLAKEFGSQQQSLNKRSTSFTRTAIFGCFVCGLAFIYFLKKTGYSIF